MVRLAARCLSLLVSKGDLLDLPFITRATPPTSHTAGLHQHLQLSTHCHLAQQQHVFYRVAPRPSRPLYLT